MNVDKLLADIIPPNTFQHRNEFSNTQIIDALNPEEKGLLEGALIDRLSKEPDLLIVETLAYLKSQKSLPVLYSLLDNISGESARIIASVSIHEINKDLRMLDVAISAFRELEKIKDTNFTYRLLPVFYYLRKFKNQITDEIIREYTSHPDYLLSYNAKRALSM